MDEKDYSLVGWAVFWISFSAISILTLSLLWIPVGLGFSAYYGFKAFQEFA